MLGPPQERGDSAQESVGHHEGTLGFVLGMCSCKSEATALEAAMHPLQCGQALSMESFVQVMAYLYTEHSVTSLVPHALTRAGRVSCRS